MRISSPQGIILKQEIKDTKIIVNVFDGSERSQVMYKIDDLPEKEMKQTNMEDPYLVNLYNLTKNKIERPIKPAVSSLIWIAPLNENLKTGVHKILITTRDQFGNIYRAGKVFEIE